MYFQVKLELERRRRIPYDSFDRTNFIHLHYKPVHQDIFELQVKKCIYIIFLFYY